MDVNSFVEALKRANANLPTMPIKGKQYVMVKDRVAAFRREFPGWSILTSIEYRDDIEIIFSAEIRDEEGRVLATGHAKEEANGSNILRTSHVETAETSAVGRALGFLGVGIDDSLGSADEIANATIQQGFITEREFRNLSDLCKAHDKNLAWLLSEAGAASSREITVAAYARIVKQLEEETDGRIG